MHHMMKYDIPEHDCCSIIIPYGSKQKLLYTGLFCINGVSQYANDLVIISGDESQSVAWVAGAVFWGGTNMLDEVYEFSMG